MCDQEKVEFNFEGLFQIYYINGLVFVCIMVWMMLFSEVWFQFQWFKNGWLGELYGSWDLVILEKLWINGDIGEMLVWVEQDVLFIGNWYFYIMCDHELAKS